MTAELRAFTDFETVNELPAIAGFWAQRFVVPLLEDVGAGTIDELWDRHVMEQCARRAPEPARMVSLGAGNGEIELPLAARLAARGVTNLELTLIELNPAMLERAAAQAAELGISERVRTSEADLNSWVAAGQVDVYLASHSLHHVVELEHLYDQIAASLHPDGVLLVNDMIGRNGHTRWPEAGELIRSIWDRIPPRYRLNHSLGYVDDEYPDLDCSTVGFEGVRSQDVLPLLLERLHPEEFVTFGNVVDPFVDRVYGPNFDPDDPEDRAFIDAVARLDEASIDLGVLTPTHLVAAFRARPWSCRYPGVRSPDDVVRQPDGPAEPIASPDAERVGALEAELAATTRRLQALQARRAVRAALWIADLRHRVFRSSAPGASRR